MKIQNPQSAIRNGLSPSDELYDFNPVHLPERGVLPIPAPDNMAVDLNGDTILPYFQISKQFQQVGDRRDGTVFTIYLKHHDRITKPMIQTG
jgi:hypothetical protein